MAETTNKLLKPPFAHNFVRQVAETQAKTTKNLLSFVDGIFPYTYRAATPIILDRLRLQIDRETCISAAEQSKPILSRKIVTEFVTEFLNYDQTHGLSKLPNFLDDVSPYRASYKLAIPVKPMCILSEESKLEPLFCFGWASIPFSRFQMRLLMTIIEDAVFTLEDYKMSKGKFICFPKTKSRDGIERRAPVVWHRGDYDLLSKNELAHVFQMYMHSVSDVTKILAKRRVVKSEVSVEKTNLDNEMDDLFNS